MTFQSEAPGQAGDLQECPNCASGVPAEAVLCEYCGAVVVPAETTGDLEVYSLVCGACGAENPPDFTRCARCGAPRLQVCPRCGEDAYVLIAEGVRTHNSGRPHAALDGQTPDMIYFGVPLHREAA